MLARSVVVPAQAAGVIQENNSGVLLFFLRGADRAAVGPEPRPQTKSVKKVPIVTRSFRIYSSIPCCGGKVETVS